MNDSSTKRQPRTAAPDPVFDTVSSAFADAIDREAAQNELLAKAVDSVLAEPMPVVRTTRRKATSTRKPEPLTIDVSLSDTEPTGTALASIPPTVVRKVRPRKARKATKADKPYDDFPLTKHASGKWQKKIRGKIVYFGRWGKVVNGKMERLPDDGWQDALALYKAQADDLHAGKKPRVSKTGGGLTLRELCNRFRTAKLRKQGLGEIALATYNGYVAITDFLIAQFGKDRLVDDIDSEDFEALRTKMGERLGAGASRQPSPERAQRVQVRL